MNVLAFLQRDRYFQAERRHHEGLTKLRDLALRKRDGDLRERGTQREARHQSETLGE